MVAGFALDVGGNPQCNVDTDRIADELSRLRLDSAIVDLSYLLHLESEPPIMAPHALLEAIAFRLVGAGEALAKINFFFEPGTGQQQAIALRNRIAHPAKHTMPTDRELMSVARELTRSGAPDQGGLWRADLARDTDGPVMSFVLRGTLADRGLSRLVRELQKVALLAPAGVDSRNISPAELFMMSCRLIRLVRSEGMGDAPVPGSAKILKLHEQSGIKNSEWGYLHGIAHRLVHSPEAVAPAEVVAGMNKIVELHGRAIEAVRPTIDKRSAEIVPLLADIYDRRKELARQLESFGDARGHTELTQQVKARQSHLANMQSALEKLLRLHEGGLPAIADAGVDTSLTCTGDVTLHL